MSTAKTEPTKVPLWRIDELPHERKQELAQWAEDCLERSSKPWRLYSEFQDRLLNVQTALNIAYLLDLDELQVEAQEVFDGLKAGKGRAA